MFTKRNFLIAAVIVFITFIIAFVAFSTPAAAPDAATGVPKPTGSALPTTIEVADTQATRAQGLSGRDALAGDSGMLFVFGSDDRHGFWMKDMKFAIDILWLGADGTIVDVASNVGPDTYPTIFEPAQPARFVLEVPAGYTATRGWGIGTRLELGEYAPD